MKPTVKQSSPEPVVRLVGHGVQRFVVNRVRDNEVFFVTATKQGVNYYVPV